MDEKIDEVIDRDSGQDDPPYDDDEEEMTRGRRLALFLSKFSWYNPHAEALEKYERASAGESDGESVNKPPKPPSLDLAWAQFEHVALGRYISNYKWVSERSSYSAPNANADNEHDARERAEPGETAYQTKLYPFRSSENDMADWGAGVGLYFQNLRVFATICFVAGLISLPNMFYYSSSDYSSSFDASKAYDGKYLLVQTSQACSSSEWRACPSCDMADWKDLVPYPSDGFAVTKDESLMFLKQNDCDVRFREGLIMWITIIFVAVAVVWACYRQINMEIKYDEAEQSASDYSITVDNPPPDAYDPVEWKTFFESNFVSKDGDNVHATCVTVVLNNQVLVDKLVRRKKLLLAMELNLMQGKKFDQYDLESAVVDSMPVARWKMLICRAKDGQLMKTEIDEITEEIKEEQEKEYAVSQIFVTFEHEVSQRNVLEALTVAKSAIHLNKTDVHSENSGYLFRGKHLLSVSEPEYPSDIRWRDLDETFMKMFYQQACTYFITFIAIGVAAFIVYICAKLKRPLIQSYVITILNHVVPLFITFLMNFEGHKTEGSFQASHYLKIGLFRWVNTVIVLTVITPFTHTLNEKDSLVSSVFGLYLSELTLIPVLNYLDISGTLARHFYGPRAKNQRQMNLQFKGTEFYLADAYTGMSKLVFLCFWYANIFPAAYFLTAITLTVHYFSYKFAILRSYRAGPKIDTKLAFIGRVFIFPVAVLFLFVQANYNWSSFPFDNVCETSTNVTEDYIGDHFIELRNFGEENDPKEDSIQVSISGNDKIFEFCHQDMYNREPRVFPAFPRHQKEGEEWMHDDQEWISIALSWSVIVVLVCVAYSVTIHRLHKGLKSYFKAVYDQPAKAIDQKFSEVAAICAYVPMKHDSDFIYPLLLCDISDIDEELIGWEDARLGYDVHNLSNDVVNDDWKDAKEAKCFSIVRHWPPELK